MKIRRRSVSFMAIGFSIFIAIGAPGDVIALCDHEPDGPDCACFNDFGAWDPGHTVIQEVALQTLGTEESCKCPGEPACDWDPLDNSGKPYYQMVLGCNSPGCALFASWALWAFGQIFDEREEWCSETISYWHRETGIPYSNGFGTSWHADWQIHSVGDLRTWYDTEDTDGGRGRWIPEYLVDYDDFELGVTVPVPGAYVAIRSYDDVHAGWYEGDLAHTHSLMVNEMWVHKNGAGKVVRVEVTLVEGNSGEQVTDQRHWDDVLSLTVAGSDWLSSQRKIYGFGIDLDAQRQPIYDPSRLHYVQHPFVFAGPFIKPVMADDAEWAAHSTKYVVPLKDYAKMLREHHGPKVTCSSGLLKISGIPDGGNVRWEFFKDVQDPFEVEVDLLQTHPLSIKGILMTWAGGFLPVDFKVRYAPGNHEYEDATLPDLNKMAPPGQTPLITVPATFGDGVSGESVRYVKFVFPRGALQADATIMELRFRYLGGPWKDTKDNPRETNRCSADLDRDSDADGFDAAEFGFTYARNWDLADVDQSGQVNEKDLARFAGGFGRNDCRQVIR